MSVDQLEQVDDDGTVKEMVRDLANRVAELEAENEALKDRVEELESEPTLRWPEDNLESLKLEHPDAGFELPFGRAITQKIAEGDLQNHDDFTALREDVEALKRGAVDDLDLVTAADPELPIENDLARAGDEHLQDDLKANELRAVKVFRKFGGRSSGWSGVMKLQSSDVATILEESGEPDPNPNTVRRTMRMLAKKTSSLPKGERDPEDQENNLLWVEKGDKRLELRADNEEWLDYMQGVEERYSP